MAQDTSNSLPVDRTFFTAQTCGSLEEQFAMLYSHDRQMDTFLSRHEANKSATQATEQVNVASQESMISSYSDNEDLTQCDVLDDSDIKLEALPSNPLSFVDMSAPTDVTHLMPFEQKNVRERSEAEMTSTFLDLYSQVQHFNR